MAASRLLVAVGVLAAAGCSMAQTSITGRHSGTGAQGKKGSSGGSGFPNTQTCNACADRDGDKAKLRSLTLRYTGTNLGGNNNAQGPMGDKWGFSGDQLPDVATISVTDKNGMIGTFQVGTDGEFTVTASSFSSMTYFAFVGTSSRVFIHTSCSQPLRVNDQFGSLVVVDFSNDGGQTGASCQPCEPVSNLRQRREDTGWTYPPAWGYAPPSPPPAPPTYPPIYYYVPPPTTEPPTVYSYNGAPYGTPPYGASPVAPPPSTGAPVVPPPPPPPPSPPPNVCNCEQFSKSSLTSIEFRVTPGGPVGDPINEKHRVVGQFTGNCPTVNVQCVVDGNSVFSGDVAVGGTFVAARGDKNEMECTIVGCQQSQYVEVHTSCSAPLFNGQRLGALTILNFPGNCPSIPPAPTPPPAPTAPTTTPPGPAPGSCDCDNFGSRPDRISFRLEMPADAFPPFGSVQDGKGGVRSGSIGVCAAGQVRCVDNKDNGNVFFNGMVQNGAVFVANTQRKTEMECTITACNQVQVIEAHISCSQRLATGDRFGAIVVHDFPGECPTPPAPTTPPPPTAPTTTPPGPAPGSCDCDNFDSRPDRISFRLELPADATPPFGSVQDGKGGVRSGSIGVCAAGQVRCVDNKDSGNVFFSGMVQNGAVFVGETQRKTEMECTITACSQVQVIEVHISCSQRLAVGDRFGAIVVHDFPGECSTSPGGTPPFCPPPCYESLNDCPSCLVCPAPDKDFKPTVISFMYVPGSNAVSNGQEGKASVFGQAPNGPTATVSCPDQGFWQTVNAGVPFAVTNIRAGGSDMECTVSSGGVTQRIMLHVSCSKPLGVGNVFGALEVTGFVLTNKKTGFALSSADPGVCPPCELCCVEAMLTVPENVEVPAGSPGANQAALDAWVASASCKEVGTGNKLPVSHTLALLNGADTCAVETKLTWKCKDDCGTLHTETRTFRVVDRTPPVVVTPPTDLTVECDPNSPNHIPTDVVGAWLTQTWKAKDAAQNDAPCIGTGQNIYVGGGSSTPPPSSGSYGYSWGGQTYTTGSSGSSIGNGFGSYSQSGYGSGNPYFKQAPTDESSGRYNTNSVNCSYCNLAVYAPCCAGGVQYDNTCQATCHGHTIVTPGPCGGAVTSTYQGTTSGGGSSYSAGGSIGNNCYCTGASAPVCSRNGVQYDSACHAHCAGEFNYYHEPCQNTYVNQVTTVYDPCGHCGSVAAKVCGTNGVQYNSPCHARCHGVNDFHYGDCTVYAPSTSCGKVITYTHSDVTYGPCSSNPGYQINYGQYGSVNQDATCGTATFTATDVCGNSVSVDAHVYLIDSSAPTISGGDDLVWPCDEDCAAYGIWEQDARDILHHWISGNGCLNAQDCSAVSWSVQGAPGAGQLCGTNGQVKFIATDVYGNSAFKVLQYSFPRKQVYSAEPCYVCGQREFGQKVKAALLQLEVRYEGPNGATITANVEPNSFANVQNGQVVRFYAGSAARLEDAQNRGGKSGSGASNKFPTNTEFVINGASSTLHTSCSQPIATGDVITFSNGATLTIVGFVTDASSSQQCAPQSCTPYGQPLPFGGQQCPQCQYPVVCGAPAPPYPAPPPGPVYTPPAPTPCHHTPTSLCDGSYANKPTEVRLQLVSGQPSMTQDQNGFASFSVGGSAGGSCPDSASFTVVCTGGTTQTVPAGGIYIWTGYGNYGQGYNRFQTTSVCQIHGAGFYQRVVIRMSCEQRLYTGDQFGNLVIVGFSLPDGTRVDQTQCPQGPYIPPYVPPPTAPVSYGGYNNNPTSPPVYVPPTDAPTRSPTGFPTVPPSQHVYSSCFNYIGSMPDYSSFYHSLTVTHVNVALQQPGPFTVFAATNGAYNAYTNNLQGLYNNVGELSSIVLHHVVHGEYRPDQLTHGMVLMTFNGPVIVQRFGNYISLKNEAGTITCNVVGQGYQTLNGYVYGVDSVFAVPTYLPGQTPPSNTPPTYAQTSAPTSYQPPLGGNVCPSPDDACWKNGRLVTLTLKYVNSNACRHSQDAWGKGYCTDVVPKWGETSLPDTVMIKIGGKNDGYTVNGWKFQLGMGEEFTLLGTAYGGFLKGVYVIRVNGKKVKFATGCKAPIGLGDQFGALVVTGYTNSDGETCEMQYRTEAGASTNDGPASSSSSDGKKLSGTEIAAIVVGCIAMVALIAGTVFIKYYGKQEPRLSSTH